jgi:ATP-dependent Clp protease ATP-binding subunit ClpB
LTITLTPEARRAIAVEGYEPAYGARPLKRALQRMVQNPLALGVLEGKFQDGDHILVAAGPDGTLTFEVAARESDAGRGDGGARPSVRSEPAAAARRP